MGAFLERIGGLFDKGLVLAAVFPLLIFLLLLGAIATGILGVVPMLDWFETLSAQQTLALGTILTGGVLSAAFILRSMRRPLLDAWSGGAAAPWLIAFERKRRDTLDPDRAATGTWTNAEDAVVTISDEPARRGFAFILSLVRTERRPTPVPPAERAALRAAVDRLAADAATQSPADTKREFDRICSDLRSAFERTKDTSLEDLAVDLAVFARNAERGENLELQTLAADYAFKFASPPILRATRLGNCLAALDHYAYKRYRMEGWVFWPHLEHVMKSDLQEDIQNQRNILDFLLALASLLMLLAMLAVFIGPWLFKDWSWLLPVGFIVAAAGGMALALYRLSITAANALGSALRAGCDLYRHELLAALGLKKPATLAEEWDLWRQASQAIVYGAPDNMIMNFRWQDKPVEDAQ